MRDVLRCAITDDEPMAIKGLKGYVQKIPFLQLEGTYENALELGDALATQEVDLLFLDIQMPHLTGLDFLKTLKNPPIVIITTAFQDYALEGYELDVLDYLLKPISFQRFLKAANKARDLYRLQQLELQQDSDDYFFVKSDNRLEKVMIDEICFVESLQNYITIHTEQEKLMVHLPLKKIKEHLPEGAFVQPHRSYLVAVEKIKAIEGNQIFIPDNHYIPISKHLKEQVLEKIVKNQLSRKKD